MGKTAVVPGSFDPVTLGHADIIRRAAALFDHVYAVVMENPGKTYLFPPEIRLALLRDAVLGIENVTAEYSAGMLYEYARKKNACAIIKGARSGADFDYELQMALFNRRRCPEAETLILLPGEGLEGLRSSAVREMVKKGESVEGLVTPMCERELKKALRSDQY